MDDPLEELTELVWPSSELPALEVHLCVDEVGLALFCPYFPTFSVPFIRVRLDKWSNY